MTQALSELASSAAKQDSFTVTVADGLPKIGGVDPLGLRQLNFDLMDQVLPGLNNVGRRVRPYVVVAWAARQAKRIAEAEGANVVPSDMRDFVDRIEVLYAWSQFLIDPEAELPGRQVLGRFRNMTSYEFDGKDWATLSQNRQASTSFTAAITYGPSIKALKWAAPSEANGTVWVSTGLHEPALDAFEATFASELHHPAFSRFGSVRVTRAEVERWGRLWDINAVTKEEEVAFSETLAGSLANAKRRDALMLLSDSAAAKPTADLGALRADMASIDNQSTAVRKAWRRLQIRQAFRYALESLFHWCLNELATGPRSTAQLVETFRARAGGWAANDTPGSWLGEPSQFCPIALMEDISQGLEDLDSLPAAVCETLTLCLTEADEDGHKVGFPARLPMWRAKAEAAAWADRPSAEFVGHVIETWLFAQHAYWSSSRSLADARAGDKVILRLRVALDEGGWRLTRLGGIGAEPYPTPDRLETALRLARECEFIN